MAAYYNEFDPYAAQWLRNLISAGHIAPGDVDERSITDVSADDLKGYTQCHFFAGIGGWSHGARLAGWPDDRAIWTGSCPCQPFSVAGKQAGQEDERHLWPIFFNLIRACRPPVVMGEQVAAAVGKHWLDGVYSDLESIGYACRSAVVPACAVDAPHRRDRLWFVGDTISPRLEGQCGDVDHSHQPGWLSSFETGSVAEAGGLGGSVANAERGMCDGGSNVAQRGSQRRNATRWSGAGWITAADGKARRFEPSIRLLANGVSARVGKLRAYGNAIVPQVAAEVIGSYLDIAA